MRVKIDQAKLAARRGRIKLDPSKLADQLSYHYSGMALKMAPLEYAHRPSEFSDDVFNWVCHDIANGMSMRSACRNLASRGYKVFDEGTIRYWLDTKDDLFPRYQQALIKRYGKWADELTDIADDSVNDYVEVERQNGRVDVVLNREHIARSDLRISTRKWLLSKLDRSRFGDTATVEVTGKNGAAIQTANVNLNITDPIEAAKVYQRLMQDSSGD